MLNPRHEIQKQYLDVGLRIETSTEAMVPYCATNSDRPRSHDRTAESRVMPIRTFVFDQMQTWAWSTVVPI